MPNLTFSTLTSVTYTSSGYWDVPPGVRSIIAYGCGGGQGGRGGDTVGQTASSGGRGAGIYTTVNPITVIGGERLTIAIGGGTAGGTKSTSPSMPGAGGNSYIQRSGTALVTFTGASTVTNASGTNAASDNLHASPGATGSSGLSGAQATGGGASIGNGGDGGDGGSQSTNPVTGITIDLAASAGGAGGYGAGGGGGGNSHTGTTTYAANGGNGGNGFIKIFYTTAG